MRDIWYSDKRDIVKWGGIIHLCHTESIKIVLQIAYYRKSAFPHLSFHNEQVDIPGEVVNHFRDVEDISRLTALTSINIRVFKDAFLHSTRRSYTQRACDEITHIKDRKIVFLDPDTGLAPQICKAEHISEGELAQIWKTLLPNDILVFYQHRFWPKKGDWRELRKEQLAEACGVDKGYVKSWQGKDIADDVIFYYMRKG